jgi:O-antigen ligase
MGMVVIISLVMNLYLLQSNLVKQGFRNLHYLFIPVCIYVGISCSTRSIIFTSLAVTSIFLISNIKRAVLLLPFILLTIILSQPYLENVFVKTSRENVHQSQFKEMLHETESRTMFTGRVGIWQDIWDKHKSITWVQQLFGTGMSSNAHSTYFFLLLQIGWLGLILYLFYHYRLIIYFARAQLPRMFIYILMGTVLSNLLMGISASTVNYTSFQIAISFIMGAGIAIAKAGTSEKIPIANTNPVIRYYKDLPLGK